jgi:hypothetical protein
MGERKVPLFRPRFNGSVVVEARPERLTTEPGALIVREVLDRLGVVEFLDERIEDPRDPDLITHPMAELLRTALILLAQGWRDADDADFMRDDPVLRLSVSERRGVEPLEMRARAEGEVLGKNPEVPDGLASQPTLSRLVKLLGKAEHRAVLREGLLQAAARRNRASRRGHRLRYATVDVDSFPIDSYGHQAGAIYNGHYRRVVYHPLIASIGESGDIVDAQLRPGNVHTANGAVEFIGEVLDRVEAEICQVAAVRMDAGFPEEGLLGMLEGRRTPYVARLKSNTVLDKLARPYLTRPVGRRPKEPRTWMHELTYRAESWSLERRVVLVVQERVDDLFLHYFWLVTNLSAEQMSGEELLGFYRQRGEAEGFIGELKSVLAPALSSASRQKTHYRGRQLEPSADGVDAFANNEVRLLLNALAFNLLHCTRRLVENATSRGWSLQRVRERVLRVAARVSVHARRAIVVIHRDHARLWQALCTTLERFAVPAPPT